MTTYTTPYVDYYAAIKVEDKTWEELTLTEQFHLMLGVHITLLKKAYGDDWAELHSVGDLLPSEQIEQSDPRTIPFGHLITTKCVVLGMYPGGPAGKVTKQP